MPAATGIALWTCRWACGSIPRWSASARAATSARFESSVGHRLGTFALDAHGQVVTGQRRDVVEERDRVVDRGQVVKAVRARRSDDELRGSPWRVPAP